MQALIADKKSAGKTKIRFLTGLGLLSCLLFPVLPAHALPFGGIIAEGNITLNPWATIDCFDSSNPNYSSWQTNLYFNGHNYGTYTNTSRTDQAVVDSDNIIILGSQCVIYGYVDAGPTGAVELKASGNSVGDLAWVGPDPSHPLNTGIEPGHAYHDMNVVFSDVVLPTPYPNPLTWLSPGYYPSGTNIAGTTYYYVVTNVVGQPGTPTNKIYYALTNIASGRASIFMDVSNAVIYLPNGFNMNNNSNALTLNTNGSVSIYSGGDLTANSSVFNLTQYAQALKIYGLPTCTSIRFGPFPGLAVWIYAPEATLQFTGAGARVIDIVGWFLCQDFIANGRLNFHLDQVLTTNLPDPPWISLSPSNQIVHLGSNATLSVYGGGASPLYCQWFLNQTNPVAVDTNLFALTLTNVQFSDAGSYSLIVTNLYGSVTSAPASLVIYSNATPTLTIDSASTNGLFQFDILGVTGLNYSVEASSNLIDWASLTTNVSPFTFIDTNSTALPQRFYRSIFIQ